MQGLGLEWVVSVVHLKISQAEAKITIPRLGLEWDVSVGYVKISQHLKVKQMLFEYKQSTRDLSLNF